MVFLWFSHGFHRLLRQVATVAPGEMPRGSPRQIPVLMFPRIRDDNGIIYDAMVSEVC